MLGELVLQHLHPLAQEAVVVVQLGHRPRRARVREPPVVAGRFVGGHRNLVAANVIGVRVAAVLVVGGHHVRPEFADHPHQRLGGDLQRHQREAALGQRRQRIALGQAGVDEAQPGVLDAEDLGGLGHLVAPDLGDASVHLGQVHRRVEDVAAFAAGQRHHQHAMTLVGIARQGRGTLTGLVVGVGVHRHQPQFGHVLLHCVLLSPTPIVPSWTPPDHPAQTPHIMTDASPPPRGPVRAGRSLRPSRRRATMLAAGSPSPASSSPSSATNGSAAATSTARWPATR